MDQRAAEILTGRTVGVLLLESVIRAQTAALLGGLIVLGALALALAVVIGDVVGALLGAAGVVLLVLAGCVFVARRAALGTIRRVGGGRQHAVVRPVVARHMDEARALLSQLPIHERGALNLVWIVRNRSAVLDQVNQTGRQIIERLPHLVEEVRFAASGPDAPRTGGNN